MDEITVTKNKIARYRYQKTYSNCCWKQKDVIDELYEDGYYEQFKTQIDKRNDLNKKKITNRKIQVK